MGSETIEGITHFAGDLGGHAKFYNENPSTIPQDIVLDGWRTFILKKSDENKIEEGRWHVDFDFSLLSRTSPLK